MEVLAALDVGLGAVQGLAFLDLDRRVVDPVRGRPPTTDQTVADA